MTQQAGFRLEYVQIFNWGTFDKHIWTMKPNGTHSLLTGANGSGKTTLIDAILTLLVPRSGGFYNQTATPDRRERNEESYFLGAFKKTKDDAQSHAKVECLRPDKDHYSVLLGCFFNQELNDFCTLVQVRWYGNGAIKKSLIVAEAKLSIEEHFNQVDAKGEWKKTLKQQTQDKVKFFDSFHQYSYEFSKLFGFRSPEKALSLFGKTVSIKVLGNLNEFIKNNMLEETSIEDQFKRLSDNYDNLILIHRDIEKASDQLNLLDPIIQEGQNFHQIEKQLVELQQIRNIEPYHFSIEGIKLTTHAMAEKQIDLEQLKLKLRAIDDELNTLEQHKSDIEFNLKSNEVQRQIADLDKEIKHLDKDREKRFLNSQSYNKLAYSLNLPTELTFVDEKVFIESLKKAQERLTSLELQRKVIQNQWADARNNLGKYEEEFNKMSREISFLRHHKSKIGGRDAEIRREICDALDIDISEIPFIAELVRIKDDQKDWELAIEKLLRGFGLRLLVPEKHYQRVNEFVSKTNLRGRVVYHKVDKNIPSINFSNVDQHSVIHKLEIKPQHEFYHWIRNQIYRSFDYLCVVDMNLFNRCDKAITKTGLVKTAGRHEKDDRGHHKDKSNFILGWDNAEKLHDLAKQLQHFDSEIKNAQKSFEQSQKNLNDLELDTKRLHKFIDQYKQFSDINHQEIAFQIEKIKTQKKELQDASNHLDTLRAQLDDILKQIAVKKSEYNDLNRQDERYNREIIDIQAKHLQYMEISKLFDAVSEKENYLALLKPYCSHVLLNLSNIDDEQKKTKEKINQAFEQAKNQSVKLEKSLIQLMNDFIRPVDLIQKYPSWQGETLDLVANVEHLSSFEAFYQRILNDDLPKYKQRFEQEMSDRAIDDIVHFKNMLYQQEQDIREKIDEINESLSEINYNINPQTYIKLEIKKSTDALIKSFREQLYAITYQYQQDTSQKTQVIENTFNLIKELIETLRNDEPLRRKVIDVRHWLEFSAIENYREDHKTKQYYDDSQGLSTGQKTKLAYTILASAIAYQFNIRIKDNHQPRSFRFVSIDEAFNNIDPENAKYAMQLFDTLQLQLMIVTPLNNIHIVEDFVKSVHYVENKQGRDSRVFNLTIEDYKDNKHSNLNA